ncbi:vacuolar protein sorting-associated protein 13A-like, partial [Elysia marginata]
SKASEDPTLVEKLSANLLHRLQLSVRHIHVRYEDTVTNGDHAFACGVMLKQLVVCTTDAHWKPQGSEDISGTMMHKIVKMDELSVYWNPYVPEQHLLKTRLNTDAWKNLLRVSIDSHTIFEEELDFIVEPAAAQARLILNSDNSLTLPKLFMDFTVEDVELLLSRQQFLNLINLSESFKRMRIQQRYRKFRPEASLKMNPQAWWHFAYKSVTEELIRPYSWSRIKAHRAKYKQYVHVYKQYLENSDNETAQNTLKTLEEDLDVTNILIAREQAKLQFAREAPERARREVKKKSGWFDWLWGDDEEEVVVKVDSKQKDDWLSTLTNEERQKFFSIIGYDEISKDQQYPRKYVAYKVQVILKKCCVSMVNYSKKILQASVTHLLSTFEFRPANDAFRISMNTESFAIEGASIEHELIPILTSDIGVYAPSVNQVFTLDFESKPLYTDADFSLSLNVQPVEIVYDEHSISEVTAFFQLPYGNLDVRSAAVDTLTSVASVSRAGLQYAIENHTTIHIALNMRSPYIVVPEYGTLHRGGNVLIIDLGTLTIESELQPKDVSLEDATMSEIESRLYDQFNVKISEVKVLLADSGDDWHTAQVQQNSEYHILPSVRVLVTFFNAVKPDFTQLPRHKLEAKLPSLEVNISDKRLLLLSSFMRNFPVPTSTSMVTIGDDMVDGIGGASQLPPIHFDESEAQIDPDLSTLKSIRRSVLGREVVDKSFGGGRKSLTKMPTIMYTGDEPFYSASDYSDEDLDKLSDMLNIKPVDDNASVANNIIMLMRMSLGELQLNLSKEMDKEEKAYLMFRVDRLRVDSALTVHGFAAYATLGGVQLVDKIHVGHSGEYMEVLSTKAVGNSNLVSIMYRKVDPECVDFATYYGAVENAMKVKVQSMSIRFDQASMMYLNAFGQSLLSSLQSSDMKMSTSSVMTTSDVTGKDGVTLTDRIVNITDQVDGLPVNSTKLNLIAELEDFSINLTDSDNSIATVQVKGFEGSVIAKPVKTIIRSRLKDLSIRDTTPGAIYPNILMLQDDSLFDLKLIKYNKSPEQVQDNKSSSARRDLGLDYSVKLRMGQVQAAVLGKFYWEIMRFFEPFINQEIAEMAKQTAVDTVTKQVDGVDTHNLRINLDVNLRTPTLLLPHDSKSTDMLLVQLGNLSIGNSFVYADSPQQDPTSAIGSWPSSAANLGSAAQAGSLAGSTPASSEDVAGQQEWNSIRINLSEVQVQRVCLNLAEDTTEILHTILEPLNFKANVKLAIKPLVGETKMDISGHLEKVKVYILQKDLQLVLGVLRYNIVEGSPPPRPGIFESPTLQNLQTEAVVMADEASQPAEARPAEGDGAEVSTPSAAEQKTRMLVTFRLDGLSVTLYSDTGKEQLATRTGLCLLDMEKISLAAVSHSEGDVRVNMCLQTLAVTDIQPDSDSAIKSILVCSSKSETAEDQQPLVALVYKMSSDGNQKADVTVDKLRLNVHIPYMLALMSFFNGAMETVNQESSSSSPAKVPYSNQYSRQHAPRPVASTSEQPPLRADNQNSPSSPSQSPTSASPPVRSFTLYGRLKEPEIVLFADPTQLNSRVAVLHCDVAFEFNSDTTKQKIWAKVNDLKLLYRATAQSKTSTLVMLPCSVQVSQMTTAVTGEVDINASLSPVQLFLSPSVMQLMWDIFNVIQASSTPTKLTEPNVLPKADTQNLWDISKVSSDKWLKDLPDGDIRHSIIPTESPKETFNLDAKSISVFFEIETLDLHVPILCVQVATEAKIEEWSKKLHIEAELTLSMKFFNEKVSAWEPLIEPVMEKEGLYRPWEVLIKVRFYSAV